MNAAMYIAATKTLFIELSLLPRHADAGDVVVYVFQMRSAITININPHLTAARLYVVRDEIIRIVISREILSVSAPCLGIIEMPNQWKLRTILPHIPHNDRDWET